MWYLYIIECVRMSKNRQGAMLFYTGITTDIVRRWREHRGQYNSKYMKRNKIRPRRIVYLEHLTVKTKYEAEQIERRVKRYSKDKKNALVNHWRNSYPELVKSVEKMCRGGI